jgi:hypothetical protein
MLSTVLHAQNLITKLKNANLRFSKYHLAPLFLIILIGLLPLSYFGGGKIILGGDPGYQLLSPVFQVQNCYVWDTVHAFGYYNPTYPLLLSYLIPFSLLSAIHVPLFISDALLLSFFFMISGLSMYFLVGSLYTKKNNFAIVAAVSSAIFYMFNAYIMEQWSAPDFVFLSAYAMYPLLFALFVRGIKSERPVISGALFAFISLIFAAGNGNFCFTVILFFTLFCYSVFYLLVSKNNTERFCALRFILIAIVLYLLVNLWWILPWVGNM